VIHLRYSEGRPCNTRSAARAPLSPAGRQCVHDLSTGGNSPGFLDSSNSAPPSAAANASSLVGRMMGGRARAYLQDQFLVANRWCGFCHRRWCALLEALSGKGVSLATRSTLVSWQSTPWLRLLAGKATGGTGFLVV